jgi:hypothetical protein
MAGIMEKAASSCLMMPTRTSGAQGGEELFEPQKPHARGYQQESASATDGQKRQTVYETVFTTNHHTPMRHFSPRPLLRADKTGAERPGVISLYLRMAGPGETEREFIDAIALIVTESLIAKRHAERGT